MENNKFMSLVYADDIGLVMQGGVSEITIEEPYKAIITPKPGDTWTPKEINANDLRSVTSGCTLFVNVKRNEFLTNTYGVKANDEISFLDGKMYFTDMFSGEDKRIDIHDLKYISTEI